MIDFSLSEDQELIQQTARHFAQSLREGLRAVEAARGLPEKVLGNWSEAGLAGLNLPESVGGAELGLVTTALALEALAEADVSAAWALPGVDSAACFVRRLGDEAQQARLLEPYLAKTGWLGAVALADKAGAAVVGASKAGGWVLQGSKIAVERAPIAGYFLVFTTLEGRGEAVVAVSSEAAGLSVGAPLWKMGLDASPAAEVSFEGVEVSDEDVLGGDEAALCEAWLDVAVQVAALHLGAARGAHRYALAYTEEREAFGKPVAHFQAVAFMLADEAIAIDAARWMLWRAAAARDAGEQAAVEVVEALIQCHEAASRVCDEGVQLLGGAGYIQDHPVEKWMRDQQVLSVCGVTPEAAEDLLIKMTLGEPWSGRDFGCVDGAQVPLV